MSWRAPGSGVLGPRPGTPNQQAMMAMAPPYPNLYGYGGGSSTVRCCSWRGGRTQPGSGHGVPTDSATAGPSSSGSNSYWYLNTGATAHMSANLGPPHPDGDSAL
ncbi:uncharacterized protein [Triticum aestivum]|uniref:uncharacterized protein n=1 Tax=Triticum aestivum TaxID=4565 RepID=UPI001D004647|nr:uncharacterized protein LOC123185687 [Triticum aestivum]